MSNLFKFWVWAATEQTDSFLTFIAAVLPVAALGIGWFISCIALLAHGKVLFSGVLFLVPIFFVLLQAARKYNSTKERNND
tara:strand:- start:38 stop:280 length:243 start_codon:yes stop_codon:yes gene_type:complete